MGTDRTRSVDAAGYEGSTAARVKEQEQEQEQEEDTVSYFQVIEEKKMFDCEEKKELLAGVEVLLGVSRTAGKVFITAQSNEEETEEQSMALANVINRSYNMGELKRWQANESRFSFELSDEVKTAAAKSPKAKMDGVLWQMPSDSVCLFHTTQGHEISQVLQETAY
eukprot:COSAG05_NODE_4143_length_1653_cov_57.517123_2_plen_166_part_01